LCNRTPKRVGLEVVGEAPPAVDLDDRQPLAIGRLERRVPADIDLAELESELVPERPHLLERALAEVASLRVKDGYVWLTGRCHE
jgi:hypothetical protein